MSFSIGRSGMASGPGSTMRGFGSVPPGKPFDPAVAVRLLAFLRPYRRRMLLAFAAMLAGTALSLAGPYLLKLAIDTNIPAADLPGLLRTALLMAVTFVAGFGATAAQQYLLTWVGQRVLATLRSRLFHHLQELSLSYHDNHQVGVTLSRVINDVAVINELLSEGLITLAGDLLAMGGVIVVMFGLSPRLAALSLSVMPLMLLATWFFARQARSAFRATRSRIAAVVGDLAEDLSGMRVIQAFAQEDRSHGRFDELNQANRQANVAAMSLSFAFLPSVEVLSMLATGVVLWFGGRAVAAEEITLGIVVAFLAYIGRFFQPILELSQLYTTLQAAMAGGERVLELLDTAPAVADAPGAITMPPLRGQVDLDAVSFSYQGDAAALRGVDLHIPPGATVALVGPTGAGKTSIANLMARFYEATDGTVSIDGIDVRRVTQRTLRRQMALVPQDPFLFSGTVADNIRFGRPQADMADIQEAARAANAHEFIVRLPLGYETRIFEGGSNLSFGQRQLICIARAVLSDPRLLILDEATSAVDTVTESLIQRALDRLLAGRTAVIIAHRLSTVRRADRIFVIEGGAVVDQGTHAELMGREGTYRALYQSQFAAPEQPG